jgi:hypothetical protein
VLLLVPRLFRPKVCLCFPGAEVGAIYPCISLPPAMAISQLQPGTCFFFHFSPGLEAQTWSTSRPSPDPLVAVSSPGPVLLLAPTGPELQRPQTETIECYRSLIQIQIFMNVQNLRLICRT